MLLEHKINSFFNNSTHILIYIRKKRDRDWHKGNAFKKLESNGWIEIGDPDKQFSSLQIFNVKIKNVKTATDLIESFYEKNGAKLWDDLTFVNWKKNCVRNVFVMKDVKKMFG